MWKLFLMHKRRSVERVAADGAVRSRARWGGVPGAVKQLRPDVLVLDLEMPRLNGLEVLDRLRMENSELPVIMCSAYTEHGARSTLEALARGASDYVMKPSEQRDFEAAMQSLSQQLLPRIAALAKDASGKMRRRTERLHPAVRRVPDLRRSGPRRFKRRYLLRLRWS